MNSLKLNKIKSPIEKELTVFESQFKKELLSGTPLLNRVTNYILKKKGKQIRPILVFLSSKLVGKTNKSTFIAASLIEILHTATLIHDDVVDNSNKRRGFFSINALWKNKIAVLVGDYLLSKGLILSVNNNEFELLSIVSKTVQEMSEGELLQIEKSRLMNHNEDDYLKIIEQKTAVLFAACCKSGAISVNSTRKQVDALYDFGLNLGLAFQLKDDLFDYQQQNTLNKPTGIDIKEKKLTLPLIYALSQSDFLTKRRVKSLISKSKKNNNLNEIVSFVKSKGGLDYATKKMHEFANKAHNILTKFEDGEAKESLTQLTNFIVNRNH